MVPQKLLGGLDVFLLAPLCTAPEQDNQRLAVPPELDPISRTRVDAVLQDPRTDAFRVGQNAASHAVQRRHDLHGRLAIKAIEPSSERTATLRIDILRDFEHKRMVTVTLLKS